LADTPFLQPNGTSAIGTVLNDSQTPFEFNYTYPSNNYALGGSSSRDRHPARHFDTEAIFVDGVFTGRPPSGAPGVRTTSTKVTHWNYDDTTSGTGKAPSGTVNRYFIDWAIAHYKRLTRKPLT